MNPQGVFPPIITVSDNFIPLALVNASQISIGSRSLQKWKWFKRYCPWVLQAIAIIYGAITQLRRMVYQRGWRRQGRLPKPVVSIGNMTVGGTGKTPLVMWMAHQLHTQGVQVAILSRGYGRQDETTNLMVSEGKGPIKEWRDVGDEPVMIAQHCPWAVVAVGPDRFRLGQWVLKQTACDCFLLDDGYQHVSLFRDVDVMVFDSTDLEGLYGVLPAGRLREPLKTASNAGAFIMTRAESLMTVQPVLRYLEESFGREIRPIVVKTIPKMLQHLVSGKSQSMTSMSNASLILVSGIGNPEAFKDIVVGHGANLLEVFQFPDHCAYHKSEVKLIQECIARLHPDMVLTTQKDAVKLREWFTAEDPVWVLITELDFLAGEKQIRELLNIVKIK